MQTCGKYMLMGYSQLCWIVPEFSIGYGTLTTNSVKECRISQLHLRIWRELLKWNRPCQPLMTCSVLKYGLQRIQSHSYCYCPQSGSNQWIALVDIVGPLLTGFETSSVMLTLRVVFRDKNMKQEHLLIFLVLISLLLGTLAWMCALSDL